MTNLVKSNFLCRKIVAQPAITFVALLVVQCLSLVISVVLAAFGCDVFPADFEDLPLQLQSDPSWLTAAAWRLRDYDPSEPIWKPPPSLHRTQSYPTDVIELFYRSRDGNLFTCSTFREILAFEDSLLNITDFNIYCAVGNDSQCLPPESLPRLLQTVVGAENCSDASLRMSVVALPSRTLQDCLSRDHDTMRSYLRVSEVENYYYSSKLWVDKVLAPLFWSYLRKGLPNSSNVDFFYYNLYLYYIRLRTQVTYDLLLAVGSFCFTALFVWYQLRSFFNTLFTLIALATNFFTANLIYRYLFDYRYFGVFHCLSVFIHLGIGVDDLFVFHQAWHSAEIRQTSLEMRLMDAFSRASCSMFVTGLTTTVAFFMDAASPLLAMASFGLFCGLLVVCNYLTAITFFPAMIVFHHVKIAKLNDPPQQPSTNSSPTAAANFTAFGHRISMAYLQLISNRFMQCVVIVFGFLVVAAFSYVAVTKIKVDNQPVHLFREWHPLGAVKAYRDAQFFAAQYERETTVSVYLVWGIKSLDRSHCHPSEWKLCHGKIIWDDIFDLNNYHAQRDLLQLCQQLRSLSEEEQKFLAIRSRAGVAEVQCFLEDMDLFFRQELQHVFVSGRRTIGGLPATDLKIEALMMTSPKLYNITQLASAPFFYRYFETAALYWQYNGFSWLTDVPPVSDNHSQLLPSYRNLLGHSLNSSDLMRTSVNNVSVVYGTKLRYAAIIVNTTLDAAAQEYTSGLEIIDRWRQWLDKQVWLGCVSVPQLHFALLSQLSQMCVVLRRGFVATVDPVSIGDGLWHWLRLQQTLVQSSLTGLFAGLALSFPVLVVATDNLMLGILASLTMCCSTVCVLGMIPLIGWRLGILECINLTLVVGLSVDYIVHMAEGYHLSHGGTRYEKLHDLLHDAGLSVLAGAASTIGASIFLIFAQIIFFMQFGIFLFITCVSSLLFCLTFLLFLLAAAGPTTDNLKVSKLCGKLKNKTLKVLLGINKAEEAARQAQEDVKGKNAGQGERTATPDIIKQYGHFVASGESKSTESGMMMQKDERAEMSNTLQVKSDRTVDDDNLSSGYESSQLMASGNTCTTSTTISDISDIDTPRSVRDADRAARQPIRMMTPIAERSCISSPHPAVDSSSSTTAAVKFKKKSISKAMQQNLSNERRLLKLCLEQQQPQPLAWVSRSKQILPISDDEFIGPPSGRLPPLTEYSLAAKPK